MVNPKPIKAPFQIRSTAREERYIKMLIYGPFGSGKTYLAASAKHVPDMTDVLMINVDGGDKTLSEPDDAIDEITITDLTTVQRVVEFLRLHIKYRDSNHPDAKKKLLELELMYRGVAGDEPKRYNTLIIDSLSEVHRLTMNQLLGVDMTTTEVDSPDRDTTWKDWGQSSSIIMKMIRLFKVLPMHVFGVCPAETKTNEKTGATMTQPQLPGKLATEILGQWDIVGLLRSAYNAKEETVDRRLYLVPGTNYMAKHRLGDKAPAVIKDPTMATIMSIYKGEYKQLAAAPTKGS